MRKPNVLISGAWLFHVIAWFLPVLKGQVHPHGLPGWQAFRIAATAVWPYEDVHFDNWYYAVLSTISAVTTLLFIFGSVWVVLRGSRGLRRISAWVATFSFIVNAHWYVLFGSDRRDFSFGYFLWWLSFLVMASGLFALSRKTTSSTSVPSSELQQDLLR